LNPAFLLFPIGVRAAEYSVCCGSPTRAFDRINFAGEFVCPANAFGGRSINAQEASPKTATKTIKRAILAPE